MQCLAQKRRQVRLQDAPAKFLGGDFDPFDRTEDVFHQLIDILRAAVGKVPLGQRPHSFIGVELRGVRRKIFDRQTRVLMQELLERFSLMGGGVIQQNNDWAAQVPQQLPQKNADLLLSDVVKEE